MIDLLSKITDTLNGLKEQSEQAMNQAFKELENIECSKTKQFLTTSIEKAKDGSLNLSDFLKQVQNIKTEQNAD